MITPELSEKVVCMNSLERMEAAIRGNSPDRIPVVLPYINLYLYHVVHELTDFSWAHLMYGTTEERAEICSLAHTYFDLDWIALGSMDADWGSAPGKLKNINKRLFLENQSGQMTPLPESRPNPEPVNTRSVFSVEDVENLPQVPDLEEILKHNKFETACHIVNKFGSTIFITGLIGLPGFLNYNHLGIYDMMTALKLEKDLIQSLVDYSKRNAIRLLRAMSQVGISGVWLEDCLTSGDVISQDDYETFFHDANTEIIEEARSCRLYSIYYITGDVMSRIPHIIDMNPDCLAFEESKKTFVADPVEIRKAIGDDICLLGNIDVYADVQCGDEAVWEKAIHHQMEAACPDRKFILSVGSPPTPDTPKEKLKDFVRFARQLTG